MKNEKQEGKGADGQELTKFVPSPTQLKLLEVLMNPESRLWNITEICLKADISRQTYYNYYDDPAFVDHVMKESMKLVKAAVPSTINAAIRQAQRGESTHTKIILGMAGLYSDKHEITGKGGKPIETIERVELIDFTSDKTPK